MGDDGLADIVPTALGPCFLAMFSIASTISDKVASASRRSAHRRRAGMAFEAG